MVLNCKGRLLDIESPIVMGILNVTPDSFYDGGKSAKMEDALCQAEQMVEEGARIIDVGGMSSRPGAKIIDEEEELSRVVPVILELHRKYPDLIISVDTVNANVADRACKAGASVVNDISAASIDNKIIDVAANHRVPYILMHMKGKPENMQEKPSYTDVVKEILDFLAVKIRDLRQRGVHDIIIDPGFGFGKSLEHNYTLLKKLSVFRIFDMPLMVGISRKSMVYNLLGSSPELALNGTTACHMLALINGARILRVHDVKEAMETISIYNEVRRKTVTD